MNDVSLAAALAAPPLARVRIANRRTPEREKRRGQIKLEKPQQSRVGLFATRRVIVMKEGTAQLQALRVSLLLQRHLQMEGFCRQQRNFSRIGAVKRKKKRQIVWDLFFFTPL